MGCTSHLIYWIRKRYLITALIFVGCLFMYMLRTSISIALVEMTSNTTIRIGNTTKIIAAEFSHWTEFEKGVIIGVLGIGFFFTFCLGSVVINLGGVTSFGIAAALMGIISIMLPTLLQIHLYLFLFGRVTQGLLLGMASLGIVDTFTHWAPPGERSRLASWYFQGANSGVALCYPIFGYVAYHLGWRAIFYISGLAVFLWSCLWLSFVANDPSDDKYISEEERIYLNNCNVGTSKEKIDIPWKRILTSKAVLAFINEYFVATWRSSFLLYCIPIYVDAMYKANVEQVGIISSLILYGGMISLPITACVADRLRVAGINPGKIHKGSVCIAHILCVLFLLTAILKTDFIGSMICFGLVFASQSIAGASYSVLPIEIAGQYSSIVKSITLSVSCVSDFLSPLLMGYLTSDKGRSSWNKYFLVLICIMVYGLMTFATMGSGELQSWAVPTKNNAGSGKKEKDVSPPCHEVEKLYHRNEN